MDLTDELLMHHLQEGNDSALQELMDRWQKPLANYLYRFLGNQTDALDLAQETFVRVYEKRHWFRPSLKFSTWMFAIATNLGAVCSAGNDDTLR